MGRYAVLGLDPFGRQLVESLIVRGEEVLVADRERAPVERYMDQVALALIGDVTEPALLAQLAPKELDAAILALGRELDQSLLAALALKELGCPRIIVFTRDERHARIVERLGGCEVLFPERVAALHLTERLTHPHLFEHLRLSDDHSIDEVALPASWEHRTLADIGMRARHGLSVLAVKRLASNQTREVLHVNPPPDEELQPGDRLVLLGENRALEKFAQLK